MKVPLGWLREFVGIEAAPADLAERLTFAGFEVEAIETFGAGLEKIVAAEIRAVEPHPRAERLKVCRVFDGSRESRVVCGADNFKVGDKAALARAGTTLPDGTLIREADLRGVRSEGMLCAADELGLYDDHSGIVILPSGSPPGAALSDVLGLPETVLTIDVTPNRGDCLSVLGIARETAALYRRPLREPDPRPRAADFAVGDRLRVAVEDAAGCPRYTAHLVTGCQTSAAPLWMRLRLIQCGIRPINNIVDVTNYVMLECGQPLHAFDLARLREARLTVRRARDGENLEMLDETSKRLDPDMLVIADGRTAVAVAGVMGGEASGIGASSADVVLESAFFKPSDVRRTARRLGVSTEASYRFERGVDPERAAWAGRRAAALLTELAGGLCATGMIDAAAPRSPRPPIGLRGARVRALLGCDPSDGEIAAILESLGFATQTAADGREMRVSVPSFRMDVEMEADLIEETVRIYGLDRIPAAEPAARLTPDVDDRPIRAALRLRERIAGLGGREIVNYSFVSHKFLDIFMPAERDERLSVPYPVSADHAVMRPSLIPQMVETLGRNHARQVSEAVLFECGRVFRRDSAGGFVEEDRLAVGLMGPVGRGPLDKSRPVTAQEMFLRLKGIAENLTDCLRARDVSGAKAAALVPAPDTKPVGHPCFEAGQAVALSLDGGELGVLGIVAGRIAAEWRLTDPVAVLEMPLAPLIAPAGSPRLKPAPAFPSVRRDLAMVVDREVGHRRIMQVIAAHAPACLTSVKLFDIFQGKGMQPDEKSLAYAFIYRAEDRTLTDDEVNRMHFDVREALRRELRATVRE